MLSKVLIVDDEPINTRALSAILESEYDIYTAENGSAALELANQILPDIILLDILMREMHGFEVIAKLKGSEVTRDIPVLFITKYSPEENLEQGLEYGAVDYIGKPFIPAIVQKRVRNHIQMVSDSQELQINREKGREAEEAKKTSDTLKNILNTIDSMIYVNVPETGAILFINENMMKHYNITEDCIGKPCYTVLQKGMNGRCSFCPCFQLDKEPDKPVVWIEHNTLTERTYRNTDCYIEWPGGATAHLQHCVDITELNDVKEQAVQANEAKSKFLATMSHEIRTPMNAILGIAEIQLQNEALPSGVQEGLVRIHDSGYTLLHIINDMLDLSKVEAGKMEFRAARFDIPSLINDTVQLNIMRIGSKPINFKLQVDERIPMELIGDELRIKQILNNLLSNAFKYTDKGIIVLSVSAEPCQDKPGVIDLIFRVTDTGRGMTEEQIARLFDEYTQFDTDDNRTIEGVGLGMTIVQRFVGMMDGEIIVKSEPGMGSTFTVRLPQEDAGAAPLGRDVAEHLQDFNFHGRTLIKGADIVREHMPYGSVLIVDDVDTNLYVAKGFLAPYGLSIDTAVSGYETIEKIKKGNVYDIIFMDHMMPRMDGMEAAAIIRNMGYSEPIIALTANALVGRPDLFLSSGFDDFIAKPIDIRQLNASLNKFIRDKQTPETLEEVRQQKKEGDFVSDAPSVPADLPQLMEYFIRDAEKASVELEAIHNNGYRRGDDIQTYIITVHAMKGALANIGESELSRFALMLENAGRMSDTSLIKAETPAFINSLQAVIEKNRPMRQADETNDEDPVYLHQQLLAIQAACRDYDRKASKDILNALRQKSWSRQTKERLNAISEHLLHGDFEEAADVAAGGG